MRIKVRTLLLGTLLACTGAAWAAWSPVDSPADPLPGPPDASAEDAPVQGAATAALALAVLARDPSTTRDSSTYTPFSLEVARIARGYLVHAPRGFRDDCSGFVSAVFSRAGVPMDDVVATLWDQAEANDALHWGHPKVGDLVFFDDTWDRNQDGNWNDDLTHVAVVIDVQPDGTVVFAHAGTSRGRAVGYMNLQEPLVDRTPDGARKNSWLREPEPWGPPTTGYLASDLFEAYATIDPEKPWH